MKRAIGFVNDEDLISESKFSRHKPYAISKNTNTSVTCTTMLFPKSTLPSSPNVNDNIVKQKNNMNVIYNIENGGWKVAILISMH